MAINPDHKKYVQDQFKKRFLRNQFRDVILHTALIESLVVEKSGKRTFDSANMRLRIDDKITQKEFELFDKIRDHRNRLLHKMFSGGGLTKEQINQRIRDLRTSIVEAYRMSAFLDEKLFTVYGVDRWDDIEYTPEQGSQ